MYICRIVDIKNILYKKSLIRFITGTNVLKLETSWQVWLKFVQWFWRRRFFIFFNVLLFHSNLPFEKRMTLHLNKLKFFSPKNALCQVWLKLDQWFWRRRFLIFSMYCYFILISPLKKEWPLAKWFWNILSNFRYSFVISFLGYLPLEKAGPSFEQTWIPFTQECLYQVVCNWSCGPGGEDF